MTKAKLKYILLLVTGIVILINLISDNLYIRLDFTEDQRYTLSQSTLDILNDLQDPVTVTAYFSEDLQPQFDRMRQDFKNLLEEYATRSDNKVVYSFINPNESDELEREAQQNGIQPLVISSREKNQAVQKRAYMGAVINYGEAVEVLPFLEPGAQMEYALTMAIKKMTIPEKPPVGIITGHGEPDMDEINEIVSELQVLYAPESTTLEDSIDLDKYQALLWVRPTDSIPDAHLEKVESYIRNGGNLVLAINKVEADFNTGMGRNLYTGIADWLEKHGVKINPDFLIDANCGSVTIRQQQGPFIINTPVSFPYLPVISEFADHPVGKGLSAVMLQFASSLESTSDSTFNFVPLAFTSSKSDAQQAPTFFNFQKEWSESDFTRNAIPVAALTEKINDTSYGKIIVFSDGDFVINGSGQEARQLQPDNISFFVNAVDYLSDDTGLMQLRTKTIKHRPLDQIKESKQAWLKTLNFGLPLLLIIIIGFVRYQHSINLRNKRREESYA
ncbi:GldG family protein [Thermophagus xiamenensis]|uniref:Gliding-associated putative ABC transporter substrate-binding component GldG n=1 Tax=Thermophagus xiamenensis TaxID=385682 RepID=A0A1I1WJV0_9BACT|nr:GldG family protein [Thermophagus xiamenensis]SFD95494.1 gliding-associated putative ABC transporter substrate-binding component GldG [Thermophagus xiamenensis]